MTDTIEADLCVIGAGSGGLTVAAGGAQMGARVVLVEKGKMGGDCLNYGCVPSKALLAAGHAAQAMREAGRFGISAVEPEIDFAAVHAHVRGVIDGIAPMDSQERFEGMGVNVIRAAGRFTGPREVAAGGQRIRARRFVVATGSTAAIPPVPGIGDVPVLTNETIFDLDTRPEHLIVIGGGPIGAEMAQAHRQLGSRVTVLEMFSLLGRDDPEAADVVRRRMQADGIAIHEGIKIQELSGAAGSVTVAIERDGATETVDGSHLLVAAGRKANVDGLGLDEAGIAYTAKGITVDARLRSSNRRVFAIGDVAGGYQFTHVASYHAGIVLRNALFHLPARTNHDAVPWVTYTDPELAQVGLTDLQAKEKLGEGINVLRWPLAENDRARAERRPDGFAKIVTDRKGRVVGATIVGLHAGELILPWVFAVSGKQKIGRMAGVIAPYPTLSEVGKRAAGTWYIPKLFNERTRKIVRFLQKF
ncbi:MAG: FAD-dependent oxidoreductase [Alphaproteobacteria bacterium]|nr:FAD-dependent oxidoreductase [Alphaproteobacteria bacterium]